MSEQNNPVNKPRRTFLGGLVASIGGALALSSLTGAAGHDEAETGDVEQNVGHKGYHESAHIKSYYDKARF